MIGRPFERYRTPLWIVGYALYLYLSGLSLRKDSRAVSFFLPRSHQSIWRWLHRFGSLLEAFHVGRAKMAVVDERPVNVKGVEAWIWMALEPKSRRLLALELSWTRNSLTAYLFLKHLRDAHGVRVIIADGAQWYVQPCIDLGLRLQVQRGGFHSLVERLSKEVKRRLKDFDLYFPCRCHKPFKHVKEWLEAWKAYYSHVRCHISLGKPPRGYGGLEPYTMLSIIEEVMRKT